MKYYRRPVVAVTDESQTLAVAAQVAAAPAVVTPAAEALAAPASETKPINYKSK